MPQIPGGWELILILLVVVLVFGSKRLPDSARSLGRSMRILKAETKGLRDDDAPAVQAPVVPVAPAPQVSTQPVVPQHVVPQHVAVQPVAAPQPVAAEAPPVVQPVQPVQPVQAYVGQQLFDAHGNPVVLPATAGPGANGSAPVHPAPQAAAPQG